MARNFSCSQVKQCILEKVVHTLAWQHQNPRAVPDFSNDFPQRSTFAHNLRFVHGSAPGKPSEPSTINHQPIGPSTLTRSWLPPAATAGAYPSPSRCPLREGVHPAWMLSQCPPDFAPYWLLERMQDS